MKFDAITIKDIAKALGLSSSTVSRALRDSYEISPKTKERVLLYAKEYNYSPNPIALSLKEKRSSSIGVLVSEIANSFFSQVINGIESVAQENGYNVIIAQSKEDFNKEVSSIQYLASRSVDGIILSVSSETSTFNHVKQLYDRGMNMVSFDRLVDFEDIHKVAVDNYKAAYEATTHFIENGYKNIACFANASYLSITQERLKGYEAALSEAGIPMEESLVKYCAHGGMVRTEIEISLSELWKQKKRPDALLAASDRLSTNSIGILKEMGIEIPRDIALIGFTNSVNADIFNPSLSAVVQPAFEMGRKATELLIAQIENNKPVTNFEQVVMDTELILRNSSNRPQ
jgi:LacI family transcriptional regulator